MIIIRLLTYFLAVWSTAELRLKNQWTEHVENEETQNETSKEHTRLWRIKKCYNLICGLLSFMLIEKLEKSEAHLHYNEQGAEKNPFFSAPRFSVANKRFFARFSFHDGDWDILMI